MCDEDYELIEHPLLELHWHVATKFVQVPTLKLNVCEFLQRKMITKIICKFLQFYVGIHLSSIYFSLAPSWVWSLLDQ